ncbi:MAG: hypothetical protein WD928_05635 [Gammaproteobacteria bacterium]
MKTTIAIAIIAITAASSVQAAGFRPWGEPRSDVRTADGEQRPVESQSYYRRDAPKIVDHPTANPTEVTIKPWYAGDRV